VALTAARLVWISIGVVLIGLPLLPLPRWVGAEDTGPPWSTHLMAWLLGTIVVGIVAVLAGWLMRDRPVRLPRVRRPAWWIVGACSLAFAVAATMVMQGVFAGNPHLVDEMAHLFHARVFAQGRLAAPAPEPPEFFLLLHTTVRDGAWVSQYPPGHTALLTLGALINAEWVVGPLLGGVSVVLVFLLARGLYGPVTGVLAAFLFAASAWVLVMSGTYMSHVSAVAWSLLAWAAVFGPRRPGPRHWLLAGVALAAVAATRPLDAVAAALPVLAWMTTRRRVVVPGAWMLVGGAPVLAFLAWFNMQLFGGPSTFGYTAMYGAEHGLGFHVDPYGNGYTPLIAVSNAAVALRRLHVYLYELPVPVLTLVAVWAFLARRRRSDAYVAVGVLAAPVLYFFYWHSGFLYGPRFYYAAVPFLVIALARAMRWIWSAARRSTPAYCNLQVAATTAAAVVLLWGWADLLPDRLSAYRQQLPTLKLHPKHALSDAGVAQALVLVPESWSARVIAGLWAQGVSQGLTERAFRRLDTCDLDQMLAEARRHGTRDGALESLIETMIAKTPNPVPPVPGAPDPWVRLRPREGLPEACRRELTRDRDGFTVFANLGWRNDVDLDSGIVFARDLFERNDALLTRYRGWDLWRWAPPPGQPDALPVLVRLNPQRAHTQ
jgi:hypothetical protein